MFDRVVTNRDNLTKRGVTLMRVWHDLTPAMFVSPMREAGRRRMLLMMSGTAVGRNGRRLGMMVMVVMTGRVGAGHRGWRWMMVVMGTSLDGRSDQSEQRQGGARGECDPDDDCHGSFPISGTL